MATTNEDKALIASSEFDPTAFISGIDAMTKSLQDLSKEEDIVKAKLNENNKALTDNRAAMKQTQEQIAALDKTSTTYANDLAKLTAEQKKLQDGNKALQANVKQTKTELQGIQSSANQYKTAISNITTVAKQVQTQLKGQTLFDVASLNQQVQQIGTIAGNFRNIFQGKVDTSELDALEQKLVESGDEFQRLGQIIDFVEQKLTTLDPNSEEFEQLSQVVQTGRQVLEAYGEEEEKTEKKSVSLRARLAALRTELVRMEEAGEDTTPRFIELQKEAGELADQIGDAQQRIKVLSSDTKNLDFGIAAIRGVAGAFGLAEGAATLFGLKTEDVQESIQRLNAILVILNGLQEIQTLLQKQSVVAIVGQEIATKAMAATQAIYAAVVGTTTGALKAFRLALLSTGIGALVIGLGFLISALMDANEEVEKLTKQQELLIEVNKEAAEEGGKDIARLELLRKKLTDLNVPQSERIKLAKEYNKTAAEGNKIDTTQINNTEQINTLINQQIALIKQRAFARAAENKIVELAQARFAAELELLRVTGKSTIEEAKNVAAGIQKELGDKLNFNDVALEAGALGLQGKLLGLFTQSGLTSKQEADLKKFGGSLNDFLRTDKEFNDALAYLNQFINPAALIEPDKGDTKTVENVYAEKLRELLRKLSETQRKTLAESEALIRTQFQEKLADELFGIDKLKADGKLTTPQANNLKSILRRINQLELTEDLEEFRKKRIEVQKALDDELLQLRQEDAAARISLLRDDLQRQAAEIEQSFETGRVALERARANLLAENQENLDEGLVSESQAEINARNIEAIYDRLLENLSSETAQKADELAAALFARSQELVSQLFAPSFTRLSESTTAEIQKVSDLLIAGQITYEQYQKRITAILAEETRKRLQLQLTEQEQLLQGVQRRLQAEQDPERLEELRAQELQLREEIAQLKRQISEENVKGAQADDKAFAERIQRIATYAQAIGGIIEQVVEFWQRANEAEQRSLERSIALQEQRVQAATRIAERGNAEYLRLEEDRLNELQVKQENAARRQLAINAVLQTSQALVAFTTALAQGIATGGPLGGIAIAAAVIGLIASGYAIISSLQNQNPQNLWYGTKSVERGDNPAGRDTVPAMLTAGEAVIPVGKNAAYHPAVEAIMDGTVPSSALNDFVNSYRANNRRHPQLAYNQMHDASMVGVSYDGRLLEIAKEQNQKVGENNLLLSKVHKALLQMGVNVNVDRHGLSISVMEAIVDHNKQKKV